MSITFERPEDGEVIEINYSISGGYYPATREQPEEFPDLEFEIVTTITNELTKLEDQQVYELCWKDHEQNRYEL